MRPLILTTAHNFAWESLNPFVKSYYREVRPHAQLVMFMSDLAPWVVGGVREAGGWVVPYESRHPYLPAWYGPDRVLDGRPLGPLSSVCYRFYLYLMFLRFTLAEHQWSYIMMCDSRDVLFQNNPFSRPPEECPALVSFAESPRMTLGSCPYNSGWLSRWFPGELPELKDKPILCAGVTMGRPEAILEYLEGMVSALSRHDPGSGTGFDQAWHNIYFRKGHGEVYPHDNSWVRHVGYEEIDQVPVVGGRVVDAAGMVVSVIHQYDRHPRLVQTLERQWA